MLPTIEIFDIKIYIFGCIMSCTWLLFFILLHRYSLKSAILKPVFSDIIAFTLSIFFFARVFHIFRDWLDEKFILMELIDGNIVEFLRLFFIPQNYNFSLFGAVFGFFIVFLIKTAEQKADRNRYVDAIAFSFLWAAILGYLGSFLGGQTYGIPYSGPLAIRYDHVDSIVKDRAPLFPLGILYILLIIGLLSGLRKFAQKNTLPDGFIGYIGIAGFSLILFFGEFLSGARKDIFYDYLGLGLNQIGALIGLIFAILGILRLIQKKI